MEDYLIAKLMDICNIPYNIASVIVIDLERKDLEQSLLLFLENGTIETYEDLHDIFY